MLALKWMKCRSSSGSAAQTSAEQLQGISQPKCHCCMCLPHAATAKAALDRDEAAHLVFRNCKVAKGHDSAQLLKNQRGHTVAALCRDFREEGPCWGHQVLLWHIAKPLMLKQDDHEVILPALQLPLRPCCVAGIERPLLGTSGVCTLDHGFHNR